MWKEECSLFPTGGIDKWRRQDKEQKTTDLSADVTSWYVCEFYDIRILWQLVVGQFNLEFFSYFSVVIVVVHFM